MTGPATVIRAIAAGKVAAANIDEYLGYHHVISCDVEIPPVNYRRQASLRPRQHVRAGSGTSAGMTSSEIECVHDERRRPQQEAARCLRCDHYGYGILKGGRAAIW